MTAEPWAGGEVAPKRMLSPCLAGATAVPTLSDLAHGRGKGKPSLFSMTPAPARQEVNSHRRSHASHAASVRGLKPDDFKTAAFPAFTQETAAVC